ncbi:MAG: 3-phosphoshikimate 1-carboxyvinyltransferase, partial [Clostridia bacterium]|nr:3-phosphoshikimate 1-carboxyvinyltransferase [Clostridia bacterium]
MRVKIIPSLPRGSVRAPISKSVSHRLLIGAALAEGESYISPISFCEDTLATMDCLSALGALCVREGEGVRVYGKHFSALNKSAELYCRESGSTLRFIIPLLWLIGGKYRLYGAPSLLKRPMTPYAELAEEKGLGFKQDKDCITVSGKLQSGEFSIRGDVSSQFITGLLFALPSLTDNSYIKLTTPLESVPYVTLTVDTLKELGVSVSPSGGVIFVKGGQRYKCADYHAEGDYSGAAFLAAMNECGAD